MIMSRKTLKYIQSNNKIKPFNVFAYIKNI